MLRLAELEMADSKWAADERKLQSAYGELDTKLPASRPHKPQTASHCEHFRGFLGSVGGSATLTLGDISDDIQSHRLKPAESIVLRYLKKHPKSQPALILRMVLLERLHDDVPAVLIAFDEVKASGELSTRGAWWVNITLRNIQRCG